MKERLQKLMAQANIGSRRTSEDLITAGRVRVNGKIATLGDKADPETDVIEVDGMRLSFDDRKLYIALNKPLQVLTTTQPHQSDDRETVIDLVPYKKEHLFAVGRLDADSEGLVVLTNDGELANRLAHPRYNHTKTYRVVVDGLPTAETLEKWQRGVWLGDEDGMTAPCYVKITRGGSKESVLRVVMTEGKKRQIRRVAGMLGHPVQHLRRIAIGMLELGDLKTGEYRELTQNEVRLLSMKDPDHTQIPRARQVRPSYRDQDEPRRPRVRRDKVNNESFDANEVTFDSHPRRRLVDDDGDESTARPPRAEGDRTARPRRPVRGDNSRPVRPPRSSILADSKGEKIDDLPEWRRGAQELMNDWQRPRRPARRPSTSADGERPRRRPAGDSTDRPRRPYSSADGERPRRPRPEGDAGDRPRRPSTSADGERPRRPRPAGDSTDRPRRPSTSADGERPRRPRPAGDSTDRPRRPSTSADGERPRRPRPTGDSTDRPRRPSTSADGERPRRPRPAGDAGDRPRRPSTSADGERPRRPRPEGDAGDRPRRPSTSADGERPRRPRPAGDSTDRPRRPSTSADGERPRRPRPEGDAGDRPRRPARPGSTRPSRPSGTTRPPRPAPRRDEDAPPAQPRRRRDEDDET
ncbi:MAG: pseudouridine synthase [bacterium]|nr:pseudouridine synthase [bacterium]